ncbi:MAG: LamG domain-containing protein [Verrucomicrobia bacterium]|nr:LamG domain-containing protein [Verrucomicrobiota bacterium]
MKRILQLTGLAAIFALPTIAGAALVAWYPLDTDANDASGNGHNGAVVGGTVAFGQAGANAGTGLSADFPDNGHIDVPWSASLNPGIQGVNGSGSFTMSVWVNASSTAGFNSPLTAREDNGATVNGPIIYNTPENIWSFWGGNNGPSGAWNPLNAVTGTTVGTWQHIAITYDAPTTSRVLYIDGESAATSNVGISANAVRDLHIGSGQDDGNNFFWAGRLDDVGIWNESLSQSQIQGIMTGGIAAVVPEPSVAVLASMGGLLLFLRRRNR